jgi:ferrous iron transport protein B
MLKFALAGNPNSGKTTLFNALTGSTAHVGNWPGVTVDKREGTYKKGSEPVDIVDLPGIYSLSPYTPEEVIARNFILDERPDCIINIVDATNLERNLYLTTQLMEVDIPMIVALNMADVLIKNGDKLDVDVLEQRIGLPVVAISALKDKNTDLLMKRAVETAKKPRTATSVLTRSKLGEAIAYAEEMLKEKKRAPLFHAVKLLEKDELEIAESPAESDKLQRYLKESGGQKGELSGDTEAEIADARYQYISENFSPVLKKSSKSSKGKITKSDKADRVLTHKWAGIPLFLLILFAIFHFTFSEDLFYLGAIVRPFGEWAGGIKETAAGGIFFSDGLNSPGVILANALGLLTDTLTELAGQGMEAANASAWAVSFVCDGVLGGLFSVLSFLPQILVLFLFFSVLEDSGYMARVAFILDRIFRRFGVSGRAFMPMIMGFGCSVPAMINTRTLSDEKERTATIRVIPFFSCGAKLPILTAIAGGIVTKFGVGNADAITYSMYVLGMAAAVVCLLVMRSTTMKGETPPFIMELPAYHAPRLRNLMLHLWDKVKHFVKKAFTIILASTIVIWFLSKFGWDWHYIGDDMDSSILASLGKLIQPIFTPLGFGSQLSAFGWVFAVAAVTGLIAKENVIATFFTLACCIVAAAGNGALAGLPEETLQEILALIEGGEASEDGVLEAVAMIQATGITVPALLSFIAFNMTTIPCFAAVATAKAELPAGKLKWTILFWMVSSYAISAAVYTIGSWWWTAFLWLAAAAIVTAIIVLKNKSDKKVALKADSDAKAQAA